MCGRIMTRKMCADLLHEYVRALTFGLLGLCVRSYGLRLCLCMHTHAIKDLCARPTWAPVYVRSNGPFSLKIGVKVLFLLFFVSFVSTSNWIENETSCDVHLCAQMWPPYMYAQITWKRFWPKPQPLFPHFLLVLCTSTWPRWSC